MILYQMLNFSENDVVSDTTLYQLVKILTLFLPNLCYKHSTNY